MDAFYEPAGDNRYISTELTRGPWDPGLQHAGPPSALLGHALEHTAPRDAVQIARITVEILRPVPITELAVETTLLRPGRSVELLGGDLRAGGETVMRATAWRIRTADIGVSEHPDTEVPPPPGTASDAGRFPWRTGAVGYHEAMEWRFVAGEFLTPGPATVWMRMRCGLLADQEPSPLTRVLAAADSGNGVSAVLDVSSHYFINTDLTVGLHRLPHGEWVCLDAETTIEPNGIGQAHSRIYDESGAVGHGIQTLFVAAR